MNFMGTHKHIVVIWSFSRLPSLVDGFSYKQFSIKETQEALAFVMGHKDDICTILGRSYHNQTSEKEHIKSFIKEVSLHKHTSTAIHIFTDNKNLCGDMMSSSYGLTKGKDFFHCGSVRWHLHMILSGYISR